MEMKLAMLVLFAILPFIVYFGLVAFLGINRKYTVDEVRSAFGQAGAVVTVKSSLITNRDAVPAVMKSRILQGAPILHARGVVGVTNGDSIASKFLFFSLPSNAVPISVRITNPAGGTVGAGDIGLYKATRDGSAVVDADAFKAAQAIVAANVKLEVGQGNLQTAANSEKMLWELLGLAADPQIPYDVVLTLTAAADASKSVVLECDYVVG